MLGFERFKTEEGRKAVKESEEKRFRDSAPVDKVYELYTLRNQLEFKINSLNKQMNAIQKEIAKGRKSEANGEVAGDTSELSELEHKRSAMAEQVNTYKEQVAEVVSEMESIRCSIGNIVEEKVPVSKDESGNVTVRTFESKRELFARAGYADLMADFTHSKVGAAIIGHRGYYLGGDMAQLARALKNYAVDFLAMRGYYYIQTPVMMRHDVMSKTAQLSDFSEQLYRVEDDIYLIATSEQPLTALFQDTTLVKKDLPQRYAGESLCFRKEAGAYGKDNAGIFRVHQFEKIEQFVVCKPDESARMLEEMVVTCEEFYKSLDISFRVVLVASGELNDAAAMKYDLEAYFPVSGKFRELVSASNCTDYQSRSLNAAYGYGKGEKKEFVHMLNATLCAIQRTLCCVVENYQAEGGIVVPEVLRKYTGFEFVKLSQ